MTENLITERPILFSGPMVRAILGGHKTQTRRVMKKQSLELINQGFTPEFVCDPGNSAFCPYGAVGNRLWVRETWTPSPDGVIYRATKEEAGIVDCDDFLKWRPSIYMPRHFSRLTLEVIEVRAQRLWEISEEDATAEGVFLSEFWTPDLTKPYRTAFRKLWDSINAKRGFGWDTNPWVWAITFKRGK